MSLNRNDKPASDDIVVSNHSHSNKQFDNLSNLRKRWSQKKNFKVATTCEKGGRKKKLSECDRQSGECDIDNLLTMNNAVPCHTLCGLRITQGCTGIIDRDVFIRHHPQALVLQSLKPGWAYRRIPATRSNGLRHHVYHQSNPTSQHTQNWLGRHADTMEL